MDHSDDTDRIAERLTSFVTFRLARTQNKLNAQITHYLKTHSDISLVDWRVLRLLEAMGDTTMSQLARLLQMDKGQLSRKITGLVKRALVNSRTDEIDSRQQILSIADEGRAIVEAMLPRALARQAMLTAEISQEELAQFLDVLGRIDRAAERRDPLD
ncbi:MarR family winged helix-turn-helix transcriptional regulator [Sulfitobacter sp. S190]|uniref:MarR family winged helix-turn-helix transcriptional regulator n=1 Tax=Sulfitobacter sp. S190 TaxID=2867022 RepID=UPI0021A6A106|nr:MarR family winged helix-turn-helix transcriptional regulator [Sulfitobacter sp. S190]UWR23349.1 MarR family winged helix-turn-helix transcriptional regulator [Sulfitobacter sp. S190]